MTFIKFSVCFLVLNFLWTSSRGDVEHVCDVRKQCILPCTYEAGKEVVIHWILIKLGEIQVHSYYHSKDQFGLQDPRFSGRTSLFKDKIAEGNASLQLTGVKLEDEGRYKCYISTTSKNSQSFVNLKVEAPVSKVNLQLVENRITCSSEGIYPEPELTWSTTPPSSINPQNTTAQKNEEQLYSVSSSLILSDNNNTDLVYSCTVKTRNSRRIATLSRKTSFSGSSSETKLTCGTSKTPQMDLIWRFNHSQIIVDWKRTSSIYTVSEGWKKQVKDVSESGDLTLEDLCSLQEGIYTCELSDAEVTSSTFLKPPGCKLTEPKSHVVPIVVGLILALAVVGVIAAVLFLLRRRQKSQQPKPKPVSTSDDDQVAAT